MADPRDPQVSRRYRELGAEEPPHALDEAILAASRNGERTSGRASCCSRNTRSRSSWRNRS